MLAPGGHSPPRLLLNSWAFPGSYDKGMNCIMDRKHGIYYRLRQARVFRRAFLLGLFSLCTAATLPAWSQQPGVEVRMLLQSSPLAGFQYHEGGTLWAQMKVGDALVLNREPQNAHDRNAVRVEWQGRMLGYVPRADNAAVARLLDRGNRLEARIMRLQESRNPWERVLFEVYVGM